MKPRPKSISRMLALLLLAAPIIAGCGSHQDASTTPPASQPVASSGTGASPVMPANAPPPPPGVAHDIAIQQGQPGTQH